MSTDEEAKDRRLKRWEELKAQTEADNRAYADKKEAKRQRRKLVEDAILGIHEELIAIRKALQK